MASALADSGLNRIPEYTYDALEVNWYFEWAEGLDENGKTIAVPKVRFCQMIYWNEWHGQEHEKAPRRGWYSNGFNLYELKPCEKNELPEIDERRSKVTYPQKDYNSGYWYITITENHTTIKIKTKILIGGLNGTWTLIDPEAKDHQLRREIKVDVGVHPMIMHKKLLELRTRRQAPIQPVNPVEAALEAFQERDRRERVERLVPPVEQPPRP